MSNYKITITPDIPYPELTFKKSVTIASSTRIEGVKLTDKQVETLLSKVKRKSFKSRDEEEVVGYSDAMDLILENFEDLKLTENHIKQLHSILLKHSSKDIRHRGEYKKLDNHVVAIDAIKVTWHLSPAIYICSIKSSKLIALTSSFIKKLSLPS